MGRLTPEMEQKISELYGKYLSYKRVASELGLDWRTVKRVVLAKHLADQENPKASTESVENYSVLFQDFQNGKSAVDVVIQRGVSPDFADRAHEKYEAAEGAIIIPKAQKEEIEKILGHSEIFDPRQISDSLYWARKDQERFLTFTYPCNGCYRELQMTTGAWEQAKQVLIDAGTEWTCGNCNRSKRERKRHR